MITETYNITAYLNARRLGFTPPQAINAARGIERAAELGLTFIVKGDDCGESFEDSCPDEYQRELKAALQRHKDSGCGCGQPNKHARNRYMPDHGAGFWDRYYVNKSPTGAKLGRKLTDAAHAYGEQGLYIGDDGKVYTS